MSPVEVAFTIPGRVRGKGRPRFARAGAHVRTFTDAKTVSDEATVKQFAAAAMAGKPPLEGPLIMDIAATINTPASWSKKRRAAACFVTGKPDIDNVAKLIGDSLNGIVFNDDSQLCEFHFTRRYDDTRGEAVEVRVFTP